MVFQKFCCAACKDGYHNAIRNAKKFKGVGKGNAPRGARIK